MLTVIVQIASKHISLKLRLVGDVVSSRMRISGPLWITVSMPPLIFLFGIIGAFLGLLRKQLLLLFLYLLQVRSTTTVMGVPIGFSFDVPFFRAKP